MASKTAPPETAEDFYESVLNEAEKASLEIARQVEGVDEELAMLRLRLRKVVKGRRADIAMMLRCIDALRRLVEVRQRLGKKEREAFEAELPGLREELIRMVGGGPREGNDRDT